MARSPTPAISRGLVRRRRSSRILGGGPCASSSHSVGVAISSPSLSRSPTSASTSFRNVPGAARFFFPPQRMWPSLPSCFRSGLMALRSAPCVRPKARTILLRSTSPGWLATKARISSLVGRAATRWRDRGRFTAGGARYSTELSTNEPFCHRHPLLLSLALSLALLAWVLAAGSEAGTGDCLDDGLGADFVATADSTAGAFAPLMTFVEAVFAATGAFAGTFVAGVFAPEALAFAAAVALAGVFSAA